MKRWSFGRLLLAAGSLWLAGVAAADPRAAGRWEGVAEVPGAPLAIVVDLAAEAGRWAGAVTLPGRVAKGVPVEALRVDTDGVGFGLAGALRFSPEPLPEVVLRWRADGTLAGEFTQAGHRAPLVLRRSGEPQLDREPAATPLAAAMPGVWRGRYEFGGYPREVTLTLERDAASGAGRGEMVIVGKRTSKLAIDRVVQTPAFVTLTNTAFDLRIEGRWRDGEIVGHLVQGPFEAPLTLRRDPGGAK